MRIANLDESKFDLSACKEFNPALVYGFDPELSHRFSDPFDVNYVLVLFEQYQDMLNAYLYAQDVILPEIKKTGIVNLTSKQVVNWLHALHERMAKTIAYDMDNINPEAGKFTQRIILRWHYGNQMQDEINFYLNNRADLSSTMFHQYARKNGIKMPILSKFIQIIDKVYADDNIILEESEKKFLDREGEHAHRQSLGLKLASLYYSKKFNEEDLKIIQHFIKFSTHPSLIPQAIFRFVESLLAQWKGCDPKNLDQIAKLVHFTFYNLSEIHPFCNGNGRLGTLLINIILRALGKPSILLRNPGECMDLSSAYSRAIKFIDSRPELLINHLRARIAETKPYENSLLAERVVCRVETAKLLRQIQMRFPSFNLQAFYKSSLISDQEHLQKLTSFIQNGAPKSTIRQEWQKLIQQGYLHKSFGSVPLEEMQDYAKHHCARLLRAALETKLKSLEAQEKSIQTTGGGRVLDLYLNRLFSSSTVKLESFGVADREILNQAQVERAKRCQS